MKKFLKYKNLTPQPEIPPTEHSVAFIRLAARRKNSANGGGL